MGSPMPWLEGEVYVQRAGATKPDIKIVAAQEIPPPTDPKVYFGKKEAARNKIRL